MSIAATAVPPASEGVAVPVLPPPPEGLARRVRRFGLLGVVAILGLAGVKILLAQLALRGILHASTPLPVVLLGVIVGLTYGLLGVGLVLVYRANRIINFAHGQIGAFAAAVFALAAAQWRVPYWAAFVLALACAGLTGAAAEAGVVRRLRHAPRLMSVIATLGVGQFLLVFALVINGHALVGKLFPEPSWFPTFNIGGLFVTRAYSAMLILSPLVVVAIGGFLKRSVFGLGIRAAAANPDAARMSGISAGRMSSLSWALAGALAAFTAILTAPTQILSNSDSFGPLLLLRALTAAVVGRMTSIPAALLGGISLGVVEQLLLWNYPNSGLVEVTLFAVIVVALLLQRQRLGRGEEKGSWAAVQGLRPLPRPLRQLRGVRLLGPVLTGVSVLLALTLPAIITNSQAVTITAILAFAMVGLSIGVLTGLGGQLTLGQFAVAAVGAVASYQVSTRIGDFPLALACAGLAGGAVSVLIGLPALRVRGLMLTVTTLGFALVTPAWLLGQPWMLGGGVDPGRPIMFGHALDTGHAYYYFALSLFLICLLLAWNVRRGAFARLLVAVRDNEENARAFGVRASGVKLHGYLVAGFIAGIGGATYAHALSSVDPSTFPAIASVNLAVMTVLGGVSALAGPIVGALWVMGLPLLNIGNIGLAGTWLGALLVILWRPGGLIQLVEPVRDAVVNAIARRYDIDAQPLSRGSRALQSDGEGEEFPSVRPAVISAESRERAALDGTMVLLEARGLTKRFGGVEAVSELSLSVRQGETLGLIGPNGAGKTTTFELLGGFIRPDAGQVIFAGRDVSGLSPEARARRGLIRSFQDAALFPTMTVEETVIVAMERRQRTSFVGSTLLGARSRTKQHWADELVAMMGLDAYRDTRIQELSTGTRRITEIACLVAAEPVCLLLDEPSSGIAQRESEVLGDVLTRLKAALGLTLVVIEHDIPLVMAMSSRIVAMADGRVIADGRPEAVANDPGVVAAYLGTSTAALGRSGPIPPADAAARDGRAPLVAALGSVRGLGQLQRAQLAAAYESLDTLSQASLEDLTQIRGIGPVLASRIQVAVRAVGNPLPADRRR